MFKLVLEHFRGGRVAKYILLVLSAFNLSISTAASFGCGRTKGVDKMICSDANLSRLDHELNIAYRISLKSAIRRAESIADQRRWIVETRGKCADERCLVRVYKERVAWLESEIRRKGVPCEITESQLVGDWSSLKDGDFEEFSIISDGAERPFASWLHHRPEFIGTWEFKDCVLHLTNDHDTGLNDTYNVLGLDGDVLYLKSTGMGESSLYRKVRE